MSTPEPPRRVRPSTMSAEVHGGSVDASDMAGAIRGIGGQLRAAAARLDHVSLPADACGRGAVLILGMGGSAIGADVVRGAFSDRAATPIVVSRDPTLPAWVGRDTLVIASSHSGRTEETLAAASAAVARGACMVGIASGGPLADLVGTAGHVFRLEPGGQPRASVGQSAGMIAAVLAAAGVIERSDVRHELEAAADACDVAAMRYGPQTVVANLAVDIAQELRERLGIVVGAAHLAAVARRWKGQLNENAKTLAAFDELPELAHNSIVGFGAPDAVRSSVHVVVLSGTESREDARRRQAILQALADANIAHTEITLDPAPRLAEAFAGIALGDWVSYHVALARGMDPTPVAAIDRYKARIAGT